MTTTLTIDGFHKGLDILITAEAAGALTREHFALAAQCYRVLDVAGSCAMAVARLEARFAPFAEKAELVLELVNAACDNSDLV